MTAPSFWFHPNITPETYPNGVDDVRYLGSTQVAAAFNATEYTAAVSRCDVIQLFVDSCRDTESGQPDAPDGAGVDGFLTNAVALANALGKGIALEAAGPYGRASDTSAQSSHATISLATGALSATYDLDTSIANIQHLGGTVTHIGMDHPIQRVMQGLPKTIASAATGNPSHVTVTAHAFQTGDLVSISGASTTPTIDGWRTVTVIDANVISVPVNVTSGSTAHGTVSPSYRQAIAQCVAYAQTIHAAYPDIQVGYIDQTSYWDVNVNNGQSAGTSMQQLRDALAAVGDELTFYHLDSPYEYTIGDVHPRNEAYDFLAHFEDAQATIVGLGIPFGIIVNAAFGGGALIPDVLTGESGFDGDLYHQSGRAADGGPPFVVGSDAMFQRDTLLYAELLRREIKAGRLALPTDVVIESWYYHPRDLAPDTTPDTFCSTFLKARAVFLSDILKAQAGG